MSKRQTREDDDDGSLGILGKEIKTSINDTPSATAWADMEDEMGEFEDPFEDVEEGDDEGEVVVYNADDDDDDEEMDIEMEEEPEEEKEPEVQVFLPGEKMAEDEVLVVDNSAYEMLHSMNVEWPCLSFDILADNLGDNRKTYPVTNYVVTGSQAPTPKDNKLYIMKMSNMYRTKHDSEDPMKDDISDDDENDLDEDPILEYKTVPHFGGVNRVRVMPNVPETHIAATWSEMGKVHIWDLTQVTKSLDTPGLVVNTKEMRPAHTVSRHTTEGFAMDWSTATVGRLLTGDCNRYIYLTNRTPAAFETESQPFSGHTSSVEDLQWSPSEREVFASCSSDGTVRIWDARAKKRPQLSVKASETDVNVITWNRSADHLLASGHDDGTFSIWDLRTFVTCPRDTKGFALPNAAATFQWHRSAITSIEWSPTEGSMIVVSGEDNQVTLWDISLEADTEELVIKNHNEEEIKVPPQLLFVHQGQENVKEVHWHRQVPGVLVSTAFNGFNVFKTINS